MYKVLIVDDVPFILEGLKHIIDWEEYELEIVGEASYGTEALQIIDENKIDILITDIKMPFMNGLELIRLIRKKGLNIKCIVLSGYDDFEYVKEAIKLGIENYLLKPVSETELISTLKNSISKIERDLYKHIEAREDANIIRDNILYRWMTDDIKINELLERSSLLEVNLNSKKFCVVSFKIIKSTSEPNSNKFGNNNLLLYAAQNIIKETFDKNVKMVTFPDMDGDVIAIMTDTTFVQEKFLYNEVFPKCIENLKIYLDVDTFITVGGYEDEFKNVHKSYFQAKDLQNYRLIKSMDKIVIYDEVSKPTKDECIEFQIDYTMFNNYIISNNKLGALEIINKFHDFLKTAKGITPSNIQNMVIEILFNTINTIKSIKENSLIIKVFNDLYVKVLKIKTIDELIELLYFIVNKSVDFLQLEEDKNNTLIKKVLTYTQSNYSKDINLNTIASEFNNNAAYVGQVFKQKMGESFTNYLNKVRVDKAKELLSKSNLKVNEISEKIGYSNFPYFCTVFKKLTGVSPSVYKEDIH